MADNVFQPPPVPPVYVGGRQPYAPAVNFVPGSSVNNPAPDLDTDTNLRIIVDAWQASAWPYVFNGGWQPYSSSKLAPDLLIRRDEPANIGLEIIPVIRDYSLPTLQRKLNPALMTTTAAVQPPFSLDWLPSVLTSWQPPDPAPTQPRYGKIVSVDNPPSYADDLADMNQIIGSWQPPDPFPLQPRYNVVQPFVTVVTYVPFSQNWLPSIIAAWQPPDPVPTQRQPQQIVSVDQPPIYAGILADTIQVVGQSWIPPDPWPTQKRPQQVVSVDNPPLYTGLLNDMYGSVQAWQPSDPFPVQPRYSIVQPFVATVTYVPYTQAWLPAVIASWQLPDPFRPALRPLPIQITAVPVNEPPYQHPARTPAQASIRTSWEPPDPQPVQRGPLPVIVLAVRVDNPPFDLYGSNNWVIDVLSSWQPPDPQPTQRPITLPIVGQSKDQPPAITNTRINLVGVINAWQPPDPFPTQPIYRQQSSVDNPPRYSPRAQIGSVQAWQPPDPFATQPRYNVVPPTVVVVYVPFTRSWLSSVTASWQPPDPAPVQPRHRQIVSVDNPPGFITDYLPDPLPYVEPLQRRTTFVPGSSLDRPQPRQMAWFATVVQQWQPPDPQPVTSKRNLPITVTAVPVDNPPFDMRARVQRTVVQSWQPPDPQPMTSLRNLPVRIIAVPVDNPPFGYPARLGNTRDIVQAWQPEPQPPNIYAFSRNYTMARFIPFTSARIIKHPQLRGTLTVTRLIGIDGQPVLRAIDTTPELDGDP